ncbi:spore coat protein [Bacillus sp. FJAT-27916]|uniref:sugar phosphate nucleotidyltransferase n=1 Tax=Bacillaceae TaxID=186817 RepID=UPI00067122EA|nr:sugar phosphate nucleotidyltransferase [Bacillus sp. FJAT-27916]KMY45378.1 spore coat protein [Bacillus sp. FJAT-27916]
MKGVILAGGTGSRLYPLTKVTNKHLLPIGKYPMIYHSVYKLKEAGIEDILIVTGRDHMGDVVDLLGSGYEFGVHFTYKVQDRPGGIAEALGLARDFTGLEKMVVILGDNVFTDTIKGYVESFEKQAIGAKILVKEVENPKRFGVPDIYDGRILTIEEKPAVPKSRYAVTGIYMYDASVYGIIDQIQPSARGELEITDVNNQYIHNGLLTYDVLYGDWTDAGTHSSYAHANIVAQNIDFSKLFVKEATLMK